MGEKVRSGFAQCEKFEKFRSSSLVEVGKNENVSSSVGDLEDEFYKASNDKKENKFDNRENEEMENKVSRIKSSKVIGIKSDNKSKLDKEIKKTELEVEAKIEERNLKSKEGVNEVSKMDSETNERNSRKVATEIVSRSKAEKILSGFQGLNNCWCKCGRVVVGGELWLIQW